MFKSLFSFNSQKVEPAQEEHFTRITEKTENDLLKYIGKDYNTNTINEINRIYYPYVIKKFDPVSYSREIAYANTIRCIVVDNKILKIGFN
jgi:hypothetical protein